MQGDVPDTYTYDNIPEKLRVQIVFIMYDVLGNEEQYKSGLIYGSNSVTGAYDFIADALCREYGIFRLSENRNIHENKMTDLIDFFLKEKTFEKTMDVIQLSFQAIDLLTRTYDYLSKSDSSGDADRAIEELNLRFREHGVGYCFKNKKIIRIDSEFVHSKVVRPALKILDQKQYAGAQQEFLSAHEHYRKGRTKEAINECLKSLESVMKAICDKRKWVYEDKATARKLIEICFDNQLIPSFSRAQFNALKSLLESSVPAFRNKVSAHGQGADPKRVQMHIAGYVLHMTAAAIVFLAEAEASGNP